ncbi:hypothetical protein NEPAR06_2329 [Nematocida parisii]|uniref:Uncharacterized protein n=1 Tax=Nematocida parisii (strain ERTm3) TaxID=935791 RepID=I3EFU5_NEMP3|nr:uncharacterized protein NEPG_01414 [Nematocida parisii ERTm1]EIJ88092.1 hypothetical protein NEQG_01536 [Nematocida parisii ERTm3]KAI5146286.1 hypothetical protein NEPAR07_2256 [Nematocida parisii]EIJ93842.1 hypothetical protein NEPG_01414 [Nematocida parisii ERTm1]KAI5156964.1 hypothetical protein NEPAR06_2329 [Nematocida parisii]KAI5158998.1 hypothetical protein NEPAR05_2341 [Nematocida parisii]|eukprot:XP_013059242.1 hypothetical protein NEPG_01414 [Nematocida parisii ERTm1]
MRKTYESSKKLSNCVTGGIILALGYISSVVHMWRTDGLVHFLWIIVKKPINIIDVNCSLLLFISMFTYFHYMLIRLWTKNQINHIGIFLCQFIITCGLMGVYMGNAGGINISCAQKLVGSIFIQSVLISGLVYRDIVKIDLSQSKYGLIRHIVGKIKTDRMTSIFVCTMIHAWVFSDMSWNSFTQAFSWALDSISVYILLLSVIYAYVYNLNHFTRNVEVLSERNKVFSLENYIVLRNYEENSSCKDTNAKNNEILYAYVINLLFEIEQMISAISKQQKVKQVTLAPRVIRKLPPALLSKEKTTFSILKNDITATMSHKIYFYLYSRLVYNRAMNYAENSHSIVKKLTRVIWQMEFSHRKELVNSINSVRDEIKNIVSFDTTDLLNAMNIWLFHLST